MVRLRLGAHVIAVIATLGACGSTKPLTTATAGAGGGSSDGGAGASGADGSHDGGSSPGTVTLRLVLPSTQSFCDEVICGPPPHIAILTTTGQLVPTTMPFCSTPCSTDCKPVSCGGLGACGARGLAFSGAELTWDGSTYPTSTCGAGTACYTPQFVAPGRYVARMCATPGTVVTPDGGEAACTTTGVTQCVDVAFDLPGPSPVEGRLGMPSPDAGVSFDAGAPLGPCRPGAADACPVGSSCVQGCPNVSSPTLTTPGGLCSVPGRESCGCGVVLSPCTTAGMGCLMPACCDFEGLCVTPAERVAICSGPDALRFNCGLPGL
jgi:hypothetical protein